MPTRSYNQNTLHNGQWNVLCDVCGFKFKSNDIYERWDGLRVCKEDWEVRHPMDFQRGFKDDTSVPYTRPDPEGMATGTDIDGGTIPFTPKVSVPCVVGLTEAAATTLIEAAGLVVATGTSEDAGTTGTVATQTPVCDSLAVSGTTVTIFIIVTDLSIIIAEDNPLFWTKLDELSGTVTENLGTSSDSEGAINGTGITLGTPGIAQDGGTSYTFDGSAGQFVEFTATFVEYQLANATIHAWISISDISAGNTIWSVGDAGQDPNYGWFFNITTLGEINLQTVISGAGKPHSSVGANITINNNVMVSAVWDGDSDLVSFYKDGVFISSLVLGATDILNGGTGRPVHEGIAIFNGSEISHFFGKMDNVVIIPSAQSAARVLEYYLAGV